MKNFKGFIALAVLLLTWLALLWITGDKTPWRFLTKLQTDKIEVHLGDIPIQNYDRMGFTSGIVKYVNSSDVWLVGTTRGELFLFDNEGRQKWKRVLGIGKLTTLALAPDEKTVYVGEQSPAGQIYAINLAGGDIKWQFAAADLVGSIPEKRSYPSVQHIDVDADGKAYIVAYRYMVNSKGVREYHSRVFALLPSGDLAWQYPHKGSMDTWINWCSQAPGGSELAVATSAYELVPGMEYPQSMFIFDKASGNLQQRIQLQPLEPFNTVVMRGSPSYSQDGKYLAGSTSDGRGFLFDAQGQIIWQRELSKAQKVEGAWLNASGRDGYIVPEGVIFTTINTFNRENWQMPTPVVHPNSNTLFVFDLDGQLRFKYQAAGEIEAIAFAPGVVALAGGRNVRTHDYKNAHAGLLVSLRDGSLLARFAAEGPVQAIDVSQDGRLVGGLEAPAVLPEGKVLGSHRFHIWKVK